MNFISNNLIISKIKRIVLVGIQTLFQDVNFFSYFSSVLNGRLKNICLLNRFII